jgi:hypothetical protein
MTKHRFYEAEAGDYNSRWSYVIYRIVISPSSNEYSVRVYPKGGRMDDGPVDPLYPSLAAAKAALPAHVEEANKRA